MLKKHFIRLGAGGNGAHGVIVVCDACRCRGPWGMAGEKVIIRARKEGFVVVKHREGTRDFLLWICSLCYAVWPLRLHVTEFIALKQRKKGGRR
jgi:hypothetical protein